MPRPLLRLSALSALSAAIVLAGLPGPAAAAQWSAGGWNGSSYVNRDGDFSHCIVSAKYNSGMTLYFLLFRNRDLFIGVAAPGWSLDPHRPYAMTMAIDGKVVRSAAGTVLLTDKKRLWLALGKDSGTREQLRRGLKLRLLQDKRSYGFQLTGTAMALKRLARCVREGAAPKPRKRPEKPAPEPKSPSG